MKLNLMLWLSISTLMVDAWSQTSAQNGLARFTKFVPLHYPIRDIRVPKFDDQGNQVAFIHINLMRKLSEALFQLEEVEIWLFNEAGEKETVISNPHAFLDVEKQLLFSESETHLKNELGIEVQGQGLVFDLESHVFCLFNDVETTLSEGFLESTTSANKNTP